MLTIQGIVEGKVQGVGFRYFIKRHAGTHKVLGYAKNLANGTVEFLLQGEEKSVKAVVAEIKRGPKFSDVANVTSKVRSAVNTLYGFEVL
jgi:acylphosphatase